MRINLYAYFLICLLTMFETLLCNEVRSQTSDTIPAIHLPLAYEDFSLYDFASVRMETDKRKYRLLISLKENFSQQKKSLKRTYEAVKDQFTCIHRGKIEAKNKGEIDMYFVE